MKYKKKLKKVRKNPRIDLPEYLQLAQLRAEKCEITEARNVYLKVLEEAKRIDDPKATMEAVAGLLRLAGESLDENGIGKWDAELDEFMRLNPKQIPPMVWYCKGAVARHKNQHRDAQRFFHRYLRAVRGNSVSDESIARGWLMLATVLQQRNRIKKSFWLAHEILRRYEEKSLRGINGILYLLIGTLHERKKDFKAALSWYKKAHVQFLKEHNWYYHLYVLYGYARLARYRQNFAQASWYIDLVENATVSAELGLLRREILNERKKLEQDAVDLKIDTRKGLVQTRGNAQISIRKQHVLLTILEALFVAHQKQQEGAHRGLSKAELIETVWREPYQSEIHDNKLYYNINRLRKLIEPDVRKPQYLLNWRQGYRLAPGLRIHFIGDHFTGDQRN